RLEDALADGDTIHALIKGSAINNDGAGKIGYTAPGIDGQAAVIAEAQAIAGVDPETITYIEAHGTGTQLGDPIEIAALQKVFRAHPNKTGYCAIGSLKTNIGHLDAAAGVASLIKTVLALKHRLLPPSLHYEQPNPAIDFAHSPFFVNASLRTWQSTTGPLRAGVSSFGIGGTNAHMILEEAPPSEASTQTRPQQVLLLSAKTEKALEHTTTRLVEHLRQHPDLNLADVAHTLQVGRRRFPYRRLLVCKSTDEAIGMLAALDPHHVTTAHQESEKQPVVFLFPGQGAQHVAMAQELYQLEPLFRAQVDRCAQLLIPHLGLDLRSLIYPDAGTSTDGQLEQTAITQPALFTIEYALAKLWMAWGIHPQAMIGHSIGEYVAACLAGVFSLEEALALVAERGRMMQLLPKGAMLTVPLSEQELAPLLNSRISLAVTNGPGRSVVAGPVDAIDTLEQRLIQQNVVCRRLHTSHAFHSWMMDAIINPFMDRVKKVRLRAPTIPYISNVTGNWITGAEATDPAYWAKHLRNTVRFSEGIQTLLQKPQRLLLEVGPGQTLSSLVKQHPASSKDQMQLSSLPPVQSQDSDMRCLLATLGKLWLEGVHINWSAFSTGRRIPLPTYPFERKRYWIEPATSTDTLNADKYQHGDARKEQISNEGQFSSLPPEKDASMPEQSIMTTRLQKILLPLREIFASLFAIDLAEIDDHMTFLEMGADSLFFLQASQIIQNTFGVQVPFRLLLEEYSTIEALALYVAEKLPPETYQEEPPLPLPTTPQPPAPQVALQPVAAEQGYTASVASMQSTDNTTIERIIGQQLQTMSQIMAQQLELLRNGHTAALAPPSSGNGKIPASATSTVTTLTPMAQPAQIPSASAQPASRKELAAEAPSLRVDPETFVPYRSSPKKVSANLTARQQQSIDALTERLTRRTGKSKALAQTYRPVLADSRGTAIFSTVLKELAYPLVVERAAGSHVWDIDGNEYVDIAMGFGALLFGHSPSFLMEAMAEQSRRGIRLGLQSDSVGQVAALICELTGTQRVAFCNSGTEAVMTALRLARTITGRPKIALFAGAYHGSFDGVLVRAQDMQGRPQTTALSPGIPPHMIEDVMAVYFGEPETFDLLAAHAHELAAILIELPQSRRLDLHPKAFLQQLRQFTQEKGIALILDEVITGFRVHPGGVQALFDIQADLVTYGKTVGGGLPVGLIAGKAEYMDAIDGGSWNYGDTSYPQAVQTFFAGTYFKHPYIMPAVLAIMQQIKRNGPSLQQQLDLRTEQLVQRLNDYFEQEHVPIFTTRFSSLFRFVFPPRLKAVEANLFFYHLLDQGVYVSETRSCFLSTAHTDEDIEAIVTAVKAAVTAMRAGGFLLDTPDPPDDTPPRKVQMLPLTEAQKELWFMAQLGDDSSRAYNEAISLHFHGPFQVQAMQRSWRELTQRHESLRTTFNAEGDCQRIAPEMTLDISLRDFSTTRGSEQEAQIFRWQAEETQRPFDLERGPLLRVSILKLAEQHHLLTIIYHHIIIDGWSVGTLLHELSTLYSAYCQGIAYQLPQPTQYSQYVRWQAEQEQSADEKYWPAQFVAPVPALNLPTDHPRPAIKTYAGARQSIVLDGSLYNALKTLGVQQNCTLFTTLLAGFQLLLHRLTGQNDLVTAIPAAGQLAMGSTRLIGHCVNFLPLRSRISHPLTLTDYLTQVRQIVLDAHSHQNYPFHKLVKRLKLARDPGQLPLTNIMFNLDYAGAPELFALTASMATNPTGYTKFDLSLNIVQSSRELLVECDYNTDLFEAQTIQNWLAYFQTLLKGMTAQPEQNVLALPLLTEVDRHRLLIEWNATQQAYPAERCLHHLIEEQAAQTPDKIALVFEDMYLTYHTLNTCANQLAHYLQRLSIRAEMRVGISMHRSASLLIGLLGILKAGCAYVPLDPLYPQERLAFMLADAQVAVLLTQASLSATVPQHNAQIVCLDSDWSTIA
ncbi:MAG TPA: aminotransferase class III-fold pyridoxal phosphate-dependent enzyme, partial [Ktedonobacteraceae bacterium]|nr:aminotransferase class III-fold pyridoxal phosphate-dependent enzyme [Ktedonobacteraceae bacterium]